MISKYLIHGKYNKQWKINFMSFEDNDEKRVMHSKNVETMISDKPGEVIEELFQ